MDNYFEFKQIITLVFRWWWVLALGTLIAVAIGYGVTQSQSPVYEATATVMVGDFIQAPQINRDDIIARDAYTQAYADMARREPVLNGVVKALGLNLSWNQLKNSVNVKVVANTSLIEINASANSPQKAQAIAGEVAKQLTLLVQTQDNESPNRQFAAQEVEDLRSRIETGHKRLASLRSQATYASSPERLNEMQNKIDSLEGLVTDWEDTYSRLLASLETTNRTQNSLKIIEAARANQTPLSPNPSINIIVSAAVGFVFAFGLMFLLNLFDDRIRTGETLERKLGLNYLGSISKMKGKSYDGKLITAKNPLFGTALYYKNILDNIGFSDKGDQPVKSLLVTSSHLREGKTTTAANLGIIMAQAGFKTIVVDVDWKNPTQHLLFDLSNQHGLMDLLTTSSLTAKEQLQATNVAKLQILTAGNLPENPIEMLQPNRMKQILADLTKISDVVILDAPSTDIVESAVLFGLVDGVILVIESGRTRMVSVKQAMISLNLTGGKLLGAILNRNSSLWNRNGYQKFGSQWGLS